MDNFNGCSNAGCVSLAPGRAVRCEDKHAAKALAASRERIPHGTSNGLRDFGCIVIPNPFHRRVNRHPVVRGKREGAVRR